MSTRWSLLALLLGCTPELEPIRWDAIDVDALREAIANPTGTVDEASAEQLAHAIVQRSGAYRAIANYMHAVFIGAESGAAGPPWVVPQALYGTSVYVLVACPGPLDADRDPFTHGSMRVDSPTLDADVISTFAIRGQLRTSFEACEIGDYVVEGVASTFHGRDPSLLGLVPKLAIVRRDRPDQAYELREPVLWSAGDRVSALFELSSGETLALDWYLATTELRLRGRNGELVCTIAGGSLECALPGEPRTRPIFE